MEKKIDCVFFLPFCNTFLCARELYRRCNVQKVSDGKIKKVFENSKAEKYSNENACNSLNRRVFRIDLKYKSTIQLIILSIPFLGNFIAVYFYFRIAIHGSKKSFKEGCAHNLNPENLKKEIDEKPVDLSIQSGGPRIVTVGKKDSAEIAGNPPFYSGRLGIINNGWDCERISQCQVFARVVPENFDYEKAIQTAKEKEKIQVKKEIEESEKKKLSVESDVKKLKEDLAKKIEFNLTSNREVFKSKLLNMWDYSSHLKSDREEFSIFKKEIEEEFKSEKKIKELVVFIIDKLILSEMNIHPCRLSSSWVKCTLELKKKIRNLASICKNIEGLFEKKRVLDKEEEEMYKSIPDIKKILYSLRNYTNKNHAPLSSEQAKQVQCFFCYTTGRKPYVKYRESQLRKWVSAGKIGEFKKALLSPDWRIIRIGGNNHWSTYIRNKDGSLDEINDHRVQYNRLKIDDLINEFSNFSIWRVKQITLY